MQWSRFFFENKFQQPEKKTAFFANYNNQYPLQKLTLQRRGEHIMNVLLFVAFELIARILCFLEIFVFLSSFNLKILVVFFLDLYFRNELCSSREIRRSINDESMFSILRVVAKKKSLHTEIHCNNHHHPSIHPSIETRK